MAQIAVRKSKDSETLPQRVLDKARGLTDVIKQRAFDLFRGRNGKHGSDLDDWLQAEREIVWSPASELVEDEKAFRATVAVPGFDVKDIQVSALPDALVIEAEASHTHEEKNGNVRFCEFSGQQLFRRLDLPTPVDVDKVTASLDKGILQVTAPKTTIKQMTTSA